MAHAASQPALLAERFASHALHTRFSDLPADAVAAAKVFILDTLGVGLAGSSAPGAGELIQTGGDWGAGGEAALWGRRRRVPAGVAALVNCYQVHSQDFDCVHEGALPHPLAIILPSVLAYAERKGGVSGQDLMTACAVGVNIAASLGIAARSATRYFHPPWAGGLGATAAVARLMGLSVDELVRAFGLQYTQTSGTLPPRVEGSAALPLQIGLNSRSALQACELARNGAPGPRDIFEGTYGSMPLFEGPRPWDLEETYAVLEGRRWLITELSHRPYPTGRATHGGVEGLLVLSRNADGTRVPPHMIESVVVTGPKAAAQQCSRRDLPSPTPTYARNCMAFVAAKVLIHGRLDLAHFRGAALTDASTHHLARRVTMRGSSDDTNPARPHALTPITVEMTLRDGGVRMWRCEDMLASPRRPLTRAQHLDKFRACWEFAAEPLGTSAREAVIEMVDRLEGVWDVRDLVWLLATPPPKKKQQPPREQPPPAAHLVVEVQRGEQTTQDRPQEDSQSLQIQRREHRPSRESKL